MARRESPNLWLLVGDPDESPDRPEHETKANWKARVKHVENMKTLATNSEWQRTDPFTKNLHRELKAKSGTEVTSSIKVPASELNYPVHPLFARSLFSIGDKSMMPFYRSGAWLAFLFAQMLLSSTSML
jgi:hypothetical protein